LHPRPEDGAKYYHWQSQWSGGRRKQALILHPTAQVRGLNRKRNPFLVGRFNWWGRQGEGDEIAASAYGLLAMTIG